MLRCAGQYLSYEKNWVEIFKEVILTTWDRDSPTSVPNGFSFLSYTESGQTDRYSAHMELPNEALMDPNFGDPRLRDMLDGAAKTSQFTAQINLAMALAMQPFQNFLQKVSMVRRSLSPILS